jgi:hypothetical protein
MPPSPPTSVAGLAGIVAALGGDLYDQGRRANIPAPGHSAADRSVSLLLTGGRVVVHGFGAADWREVLDDLRVRGLIDARGAPSGGGGAAPAPPTPPSGPARIAAALALWEAGVALGAGSLAARHLRLRGVTRPTPGLCDLRSHPACPLSVYRPGSDTRPALLAAVRGPEGTVTAVEVTYLDRQGRRATDLRLPRKTVGRLPAGAAVRLDPAGETLLVAEGVFTALAAGARFGLPAWALMSAGNLRRWSPPAGVRRVVVAADRDPAGETCARLLAGRLQAGGREVSVRLPPPGFSDWDEVREDEARAEAGGRTTGEASPGAGPGDRT